MKIDSAIFRTYDIRGIFNDSLTPDIAEVIGKAFGLLIRERVKKRLINVAVGRDIRLHSQVLSNSLIRGLTIAGINVIDLGVCSTPALYFSLHVLPVDGGIMITGSHNPPEFNGMKMCIGKSTIFGNDIQILYEITQNLPKFDFRKGEVRTFNILEIYKSYLIENFEFLKDGIRKIGSLKIGVDAGNGVGGIIIGDIFKKLGIDSVNLFFEPDGRFPNHIPDPTLTNTLNYLVEEVKSKKLSFGISFDGDVDRIGVIDENGKIIYGDQLTWIFAKDILKKYPGAKIIGEVKCSKSLFDGIKELGGIPIISPVGHSLIKNRIKIEEALLAGEMSGHIYFNDQYFGYDDAIYATMRLIEIFIKEKIKNRDFVFSDLLRGFKKRYVSPEIRIKCSEDLKFEIVKKFLQKFKTLYPKISEEIEKVITIDGVRIEFKNGWGLLRASNTQPALVMRFEFDNEKEIKKYKRIFEDIVKKLEVEI